MPWAKGMGGRTPRRPGLEEGSREEKGVGWGYRAVRFVKESVPKGHCCDRLRSVRICS